MTTPTPLPPPLDADLEQLLRRMRLPHIRRTAPEVLATARAQRWEPAEVLRALLVEEIAGRERYHGRPPAGPRPVSRPAKPSTPGTRSTCRRSPLPPRHALRTLEWVGRAENLVVCGPSGTGKTFFLEALGQAAVEAGDAGRLVQPRKPRRARRAATEPTTPSTRPSPGSCEPTSSSSTTSACCPSVPTPPKASTGSSTPPTNDDPWPSAPTCTPQASTSSCPKHWPPPPSTGSCTTPTCAPPPASHVRLAQATAGHGVTPLLEPGDHPTTNKRRLPKTIS